MTDNDNNTLTHQDVKFLGIETVNNLQQLYDVHVGAGELALGVNSDVLVNLTAASTFNNQTSNSSLYSNFMLNLGCLPSYSQTNCSYGGS